LVVCHVSFSFEGLFCFCQFDSLQVLTKVPVGTGECKGYLSIVNCRLVKRELKWEIYDICIYILSEVVSYNRIALNGIQTFAQKYTVHIKLQYSEACYNSITPTRLDNVIYVGKQPQND
jgi:hypothetical protein